MSLDVTEVVKEILADVDAHKEEPLTPLDDAEEIILSVLSEFTISTYNYIFQRCFNQVFNWTSRPFSLFQYKILRDFLQREESARSALAEERRRINAKQFESKDSSSN